jgi:hypothetical protein
VFARKVVRIGPAEIEAESHAVAAIVELGTNPHIVMILSHDWLENPSESCYRIDMEYCELIFAPRGPRVARADWATLTNPEQFRATTHSAENVFNILGKVGSELHHTTDKTRSSNTLLHGASLPVHSQVHPLKFSG